MNIKFRFGGFVRFVWEINLIQDTIGEADGHNSLNYATSI